MSFTVMFSVTNAPPCFERRPQLLSRAFPAASSILASVTQPREGFGGQPPAQLWIVSMPHPLLVFASYPAQIGCWRSLESDQPDIGNETPITGLTPANHVHHDCSSRCPPAMLPLLHRAASSWMSFPVPFLVAPAQALSAGTRVSLLLHEDLILRLPQRAYGPGQSQAWSPPSLVESFILTAGPDGGGAANGTWITFSSHSSLTLASSSACFSLHCRNSSSKRAMAAADAADGAAGRGRR